MVLALAAVAASSTCSLWLVWRLRRSTQPTDSFLADKKLDRLRDQLNLQRLLLLRQSRKLDEMSEQINKLGNHMGSDY